MKHVHTSECRYSMQARGDGRMRRKCLTAEAEYARNQYLGQKPDGWEDEFGPVPQRVVDNKWLDEVIVLRVLSGSPSGRWPTPLEWRHILRRQKANGTRDEQIYSSTGATQEQVTSMRNRYSNE